MKVHRALIPLAMLAGVLVPSASAHATSERHCIVRVTGNAPSGELITTAPTCFATYDEAMASVGATPNGQMVSMTATTFVLATHYDGANFTGSSTSVVGSDCAGGWLNTSATWSNRISSTKNLGCFRVRHFDYANLTGTFEDTTASGGNLYVLDNQTESIQYLS